MQEVVSRIELGLSSSGGEQQLEWRVNKVSAIPFRKEMEQRELVDLRDEAVVQSVCRKRDTSKW